MELYGNAAEYLEGHEYAIALEGVHNAVNQQFDFHIGQVRAAVQANDFDKAMALLEEAKAYAAGQNAYDDQKMATCDNETAQISAKRAMLVLQQTMTQASSYKEQIAKAGNIKTLFDRTRKWTKDGNPVDLDAMNEKVEELRKAIKPRELANFEKILAQLMDLVKD